MNDEPTTDTSETDDTEAHSLHRIIKPEADDTEGHYSSGRFVKPEADDTEGHSSNARFVKPEGEDDVEGHGFSGRF